MVVGHDDDYDDDFFVYAVVVVVPSFVTYIFFCGKLQFFQLRCTAGTLSIFNRHLIVS